jgi:hypothetical protein
MLHFLLKLVLLGVIVVGALVLLVHVFPVIVVVLAVIGLVKVYQMLRGPKYPPGGR